MSHFLYVIIVGRRMSVCACMQAFQAEEFRNMFANLLEVRPSRELDIRLL